jgi:hypothetical protein
VQLSAELSQASLRQVRDSVVPAKLSLDVLVSTPGKAPVKCTLLLFFPGPCWPPIVLCSGSQSFYMPLRASPSPTPTTGLIGVRGVCCCR